MGFSTQIFGAPGRYVQGAGAITEIGAHAGALGGRVLVVGGKTGLAATRQGRETGFSSSGVSQLEELFGGEASDREIDRLTCLGRQNGCDLLMASGGGKAIDAVKAAAEDLGVPAIIVPTVASNDAPCSALSVVYNEDGSFSRLRPLKRSPGLVLVDTEIIARAPVRTLVAGMGDALATWFEADACQKAYALNNFGGHISAPALALARLCLDTLLEHGAAAKAACENQAVTPAFEKVVEANTLLSGLGFESGGVGIAHALSEGFSAVPSLHRCLHGETVAFGLLVHLILEDRPAAVLNEIYAFCLSVGLPVTLADIGGAHLDRETLRRAAEASAAPGKPSHNMAFPVTGGVLYDAILTADALGRRLKAC
ncbi:glycerol 2-dehydrogenase (NAD+) [Sporobacter termitidis DSM 10068]|uniref:Glycerol dehydrogenase n=1 Tax=Sporobacter termitidis DSM 10068 TaxID=1123282 RepID=A0A1M5ZHB7_9FIRM|nr:glycerol dehydrogenase [Sporobacter termitidis]SHI23588.1 glycerol 2-dehydrogenase (NAD+) [Sporobacter termitidis DSM 10068]